MRTIIVLALMATSAWGRVSLQGDCTQGNYPVQFPTLGYTSSTLVQRSFPGCTVAIYVNGTGTPGTLALIFSDNAGTPLSNPFTANASGHWQFWADGRVNVALSGGGISTPFTLFDYKMQDIVSVKDFGATGNGTTDDTTSIQNAVNATQGGLLFPAGTYKITSQITVATLPLSVLCDSKASVFQPSGALSGYVFNVTAAAQGFFLSGCTFDMTNAGSQGAIQFNGQTWPQVQNSKFTYPANASGAAIKVQNTGFMDLSHLYWVNPGFCVDIQGDAALEDQISDSRCDSAGTGIRVSRTVTTDIGALYINNVQVVNSSNRASNQGIILTSTVASTAMPTQITATVVDNSLGGPGLTVKNISQVSVVNSWLTSSTEALHLEGSAEFRAVGNQNFQSSKWGVAFYANNVSTMIQNNKIFGTLYGIYIDPAATFNGLQIGNNVIDGVAQPLTNNLAAIIHAGTPGGTPLGQFPLTSSGQMVWVDDSVNIGKNSLEICTVKPGVTLPCKFLTVNAVGNLVFFGNDATANSFTVIDPALGGGISIGKGAAISFAQSGLVNALNFGVIAANSCTDITGVAFVGAASGDTLLVSPPSGFMTKACGAVPSCLTAAAYVTGADTITVRGCNVSVNASANTGAQNFRIDLLKH